MIVAELAAKLGLIPDEAEWKHGHELVESLHHAVEAYLGFEGLKKVKELVEGTVEAAVEAKHLGERLGITAEAVQELGYAADVTGSSSEGLTIGMQRLAMGMEQLHKTGTGPARDALAALKVHMSELKGENLEQNLETIADHFAKLPPEANRTALAMELFGRSGAQLVPLLNKGGAGIRELREEAQKLGVVMGDDDVEKAEEFEISQKKLAATLTGLRNTAVQALLPALQEMVEGLTNWVSENREAIASTLEKVIRAIAAAFKFVGETIAEVTEFFQEHQEFAISAIEAIGAVLAVFAANAAADWIIAFAPIAAAVLAITGIIELIKNWGAIWDWVSEKAHNVFESIDNWGKDLVHSIEGAFSDAWDNVVDAFESAWEAIRNAPVLKQIIDIIEKIVSGIEDIREFFSTGDEHIQNFFASHPDAQNTFLGRAIADNAGGGSTNTTNLNGDVVVHIDASDNDLDEEAVGEIVGKKVREHQQDMVREAYANISGGKR